MSSSYFFISRAGSNQANKISRALLRLHDESDRAAAIIAASIVEDSLVRTTELYLHKHEKIFKDLFRTGGAIGFFGTRIDLGLLIGLYGKEAHNDLNIIKDIRNKFAHSLDVESFSSDWIRQKTKSFKIIERHTLDSADYSEDTSKIWKIGIADRSKELKNPRSRFLIAAQVLSFGLSIPSPLSAMPKPVF